MPIVRTYACPACNHMMEVMLAAEEWDAEPPPCPACESRAMRQEFRPVAIGGSAVSRAADLAADIADKDYNVADMSSRGDGEPVKVRYKDTTSRVLPSTWVGANEALETAVAVGRQTRINFGNGLDVLQHALKTGAQPDLIEQSKKRAIRVW